MRLSPIVKSDVLPAHIINRIESHVCENGVKSILESRFTLAMELNPNEPILAVRSSSISKSLPACVAHLFYLKVFPSNLFLELVYFRVLSGTLFVELLRTTVFPKQGW